MEFIKCYNCTNIFEVNPNHDHKARHFQLHETGWKIINGQSSGHDWICPQCIPLFNKNLHSVEYCYDCKTIMKLPIEIQPGHSRPFQIRKLGWITHPDALAFTCPHCAKDEDLRVPVQEYTFVLTTTVLARDEMSAFTEYCSRELELSKAIIE